MSRIIISIVTLIFLTLGVARGADIYVPDNYPTIQDAINAAVNGDTVIVRPGTYVENIDFLGKAITVKSEQGPDYTVIDGNKVGSVVTFENGEGEHSVLHGFMVRNGYALDGGGIFCSGSSPTLWGNSVSDNVAGESSGNSGEGGGIYCLDSAPTIRENLISSNYSKANVMGSGGYGGGIFCDNSSPFILNNIIIANTCGGGGGIYCDIGSSPFISGNDISGNGADDYYVAALGGGIYSSGSPSIVNNRIHDNWASDGAYGSGGGIYCSGDGAHIQGNIIFRNSAENQGSGIYIKGDEQIITGNTITKNKMRWGYSGTGGGIYGGNSTSCITNNIFWDNTAMYDPEISGNGTVEYCDVKGGWPGTGNIDADPLFVHPGSRDFHITWNSPCRNSGDNSVVTELHDFEGDPRIHDGTVDMGADEFHLHLYPVGDIVPGARIRMTAVGTPGTGPLTLGLGSGLQDPPQATPFGNLYLQWPILWRIPMPDIGSNGLSVLAKFIPGTWLQGEQYPFQAVAGNELTNLIILTVE